MITVKIKHSVWPYSSKYLNKQHCLFCDNADLYKFQFLDLLFSTFFFCPYFIYRIRWRFRIRYHCVILRSGSPCMLLFLDLKSLNLF